MVRDDREHHELKVLFDNSDVAKRVACAHADADPRQSSHKIEKRELRVRHRSTARDKRDERADDRHELTEDDRLATVFFEERMGLHQVPAVHHTVPKAALVFGAKDPRTDEVADRVVRGVPQDGCDNEQRSDDPDVQNALGGERPARK